jgi:hypothetical protein
MNMGNSSPVAVLAGVPSGTWHAATDANGATLTSTHTADSGHLMYWEYGVQDSAWVVTR